MILPTGPPAQKILVPVTPTRLHTIDPLRARPPSPTNVSLEEGEHA
jgi:hypothetical protein